MFRYIFLKKLKFNCLSSPSNRLEDYQMALDMKHNYNDIIELETALLMDWRCFFEIENPTEEVCELAFNILLDKYGEKASIKFFSLLDASQQTDKMCEMAIKKYRNIYASIKDITNRHKLLYLKYRKNVGRNSVMDIEKGSVEASDEVIFEIVCCTAILESENKLQYFKNVTCDLYIKIITRVKCDIHGFSHYNLEAIKKDPYCIKYITQTKEFCDLAFGIDTNLVFHINNKFKTPNMIQWEDAKIIRLMNSYTLNRNIFISNYLEKVGLNYQEFLTVMSEFIHREKTNKENKHIKTQPTNKENNHIKTQPTNKQRGYLAIFNKDQTPEICLEAVSQNGMLLKYVEKNNITPEICIAAVKNNKDAIRFVPEGPMLEQCKKEICETNSEQVQEETTKQIHEETQPFVDKEPQDIEPTREQIIRIATMMNMEVFADTKIAEIMEADRNPDQKYFVKNYNTRINNIMNFEELSKCVLDLQSKGKMAFRRTTHGKVVLNDQCDKKTITYIRIN